MTALLQPADRLASPLPSLAAEPGAAWLARGLTDLVPPASVPEARSCRDELATLLSREREAAADFLLALADFDRRRGWERLGHASLFAFLTRELKLSAGAAQLRLSAARLLPHHSAVEEALRAGRLCISAVGQLARVLTPENEAEVLPRFFGVSAREAQEVAAAIKPDPAPVRREVVTRVGGPPSATLAFALPAPALHPSAPLPPSALPAPPRTLEVPSVQVAVRAAADPLHTREVAAPAPAAPPRSTVEPLTAELRRLHLTVSSRLLAKVARARDGLSHALPGAKTEQVIEAALDALLEKQARRKALVKNPRSASPRGVTDSPSAPPPTAATSAATATPAARRRPPLPAAVEREVRLRDGDRCQFPLDAGAVCGSTWQVELDHVVPVALGGPSTVTNLRGCCRTHNRLAAGLVLGSGALARGR